MHPDHLSAAAEFKRLRDAATPGKWQSLELVTHGETRRRVYTADNGSMFGVFDAIGFNNREHDANFIAAARNTDLPERIEQLVVEVARLQDELKAACEQRDSNARALLNALEEIT